MAFLGQEEQLREFQDRFRFFYIALGLACIVIVSRLLYLQVFFGDELRRASEEQRLKRMTIRAPRGMIFDRNRTLLIDNRPSFDLEITPQYLYEAEDKEEVLEKLSKLIQMPPGKIEASLKKNRQPAFMPVKIKTDLTRDEVAQIESWKLDMPGVQVVMEIQRTNIFGDVASNLLGFIGKVSTSELPKLRKKGLDYSLEDDIGKAGIEQELEHILRGVDGEEVVEVNALGRRITHQKENSILSDSTFRDDVAGKNLILTIDQDLQLAAKEAFGDKVGSLVAMNPKTGEILAMISRPSFDPTQFSRGIDPEVWKSLMSNENRPLRDKTLQDHYSPGSVFKVVTAIAGLEEGAISETSTFHCPGVMRVGNRPVHCHRRGGHGNVNVVNALAMSCDIFFYRTAMKLRSVDVIAEWAKKLGLGQKTGIQLSREVPGLIPTEEWKMRRFGKAWTVGETVSVSIGQGFVLATTLQLTNMFSTLANGGTLYRPYYLKSIESSDGETLKEFAPEVRSTVEISEKTLQLVKAGLWGVINKPGATAYHQRIPGVDFVGKTGTVQLIRIAAEKIFQKCELMPQKYRHNGVFVGFAPKEDPVIAVGVIAEHACSGSAGAAPIARAVIAKYLQKYFPDILSGKPLAVPKPKPSEVDEEVTPLSEDEDIPAQPQESQ